MEGELRRITVPEVTIQGLWMALVERAGKDGEWDVKAAAALAEIAVGLRAS